MSLNSWLGTGVQPIDEAQRAARAWWRIQRNPTQISIRRGQNPAGLLEAQTVRVEADNTATTREGINSVVGWQRVVVFGVRCHDTIPDTDIQRSDMFTINNVRYEVISIMTPPGEVQAYCQATKAT